MSIWVRPELLKESFFSTDNDQHQYVLIKLPHLQEPNDPPLFVPRPAIEKTPNPHYLRCTACYLQHHEIEGGKGGSCTNRFEEDCQGVMEPYEDWRPFVGRVCAGKDGGA
jgi:hypothetical protein